MNQAKQSVTIDKKRITLYDIDQEDWWKEFQILEGPLTKCLLLVAIMKHNDLIKTKESTQFKTYLMQSTDQKIFNVVQHFERIKNLYILRNMLRGRLGLPYIKLQADTCSGPISPQPRRHQSEMLETLWECDSPPQSEKFALTKHAALKSELNVLS